MRRPVVLTALIFAVPALAGSAPFLPRNPTPGASAIVFELGGDLWSVSREGGGELEKR